MGLPSMDTNDSPAPLTPHRRGLRPLGAAVALALGAAALTATPAVAASPGSDRSPGWLSGRSGTSRGAAEITSTWADDDSSAVSLGQLAPGGELGSWCGSLDLAVGAFTSGTWRDAADGGHDDLWRRSLTALREKWTALQDRCRAAGDPTPNTLYVRFAHEANGNWYDWSIRDTDPATVKAAWARYSRLKDEILPGAELVMSLNRESLGMSRPWTDYFPGRDVVDVLGVDYYNQYPYVASQGQWDASADDTSGGGPLGLQAHLDFARSVGLPLSVNEWSGNADEGDSPVFVENMHRFFATHAGSGAGELLYEVQFNVDRDGGRWSLTPGRTRMPRSAQAYADLF